MRLPITGGGGMLARGVQAELARRGHDVIVLDRQALDVTDRAAVLETIVGLQPDAVLHCAAYTAVDAAELDEETAFRVNAEATRHMAEACQNVGALLVYPSTDYVFSGNTDRPYRCDDTVGPVNVYGWSKLAGENAAAGTERFLTVRTSWLYGAGGRNFVDTVVNRSEAGDSLSVVCDQVGRPTSTSSLAAAIGDLLEAEARGVFHVTDAGPPVSWYDLARAIVRLRGLEVDVSPVATAGSERSARRPAYSVLDCSATEEFLGGALPDWRDSLARYLERDEMRVRAVPALERG